MFIDGAFSLSLCMVEGVILLSEVPFYCGNTDPIHEGSRPNHFPKASFLISPYWGLGFRLCVCVCGAGIEPRDLNSGLPLSYLPSPD
jgi:hypothetical protein